jgi:hypothetical protein
MRYMPIAPGVIADSAACFHSASLVPLNNDSDKNAWTAVSIPPTGGST